MDRLILLRHAKAEAEAPSGDDFDRALAPRGLREGREMGEQLASLGLKPDLALVSPAQRTRETWELVEAACPGARVVYPPELYNADAAMIRRVAERAGETAGTVIVVGHNPGLQELAVRLLMEAGGPQTFIARARNGFPPAAAAVFEITPYGRPVADGLYYPERHR